MPATASRKVRFAVLAMALASALAARLVAHVALGDVPRVMDEIAYLFQAKVMAAGQLQAPVALPRAAFNMWFVDDRAARFGIFPPGWPVVLALGVRLGIVHWINPLLHLATVILVGRAGRRLGGPRLELVAAMLYAASPQAVLLASSLMSHSLVALAASITTLAIAILLEEERPTRSLVVSAGVAVGITIATRPLCAVVLGAPLVAIVLLRAPRLLLPTVAGMAPFVALLGAFNRALTGSMLRFPQSAYFDEHIAPANVPFFTYGRGCNSLGFGAACDHTVRGAVHTVHAALTDAGDNLRSWSLLVAGPLMIVGVGLALARRSTRRKAMWLVAPAILAIGLYGLYWQAGVCYGARFYHAALPALVLAVGLGIASLPVRSRGASDVDSTPSPIRLAMSSPRVFHVALACALLFDAGAFAVSLRELTSWSWWGTDDRFAQLGRRWHDGPAVVMVAFGPDDVKNPELVATGSAGANGTWLLGIRALAALGQNSPIDHGDIVFAKFHPALVTELAARFPDRSLWLYTAWADRSKDVLERWDAGRFAGHTYRRPADNFDGFRVSAPYALPAPLLREPTDEGWPP